MRRVLSILTTMVLVLSFTSCEIISDEVKTISLNATTQGFIGEGAEITTAWSEGEKIALLSSEDWTNATLAIASGVGSTDAVFTGDSRGSKRYYAFRPASAFKSVDLGIVNIEVEPNNIVLGGEDIANALPQVGVGNKNGLTFSNLLGVVQIPVSGNFKINKIEVVAKGGSLYGSYVYDTTTSLLTANETFSSVVRELSTPVAVTSSGTDIFVVMPASEGVSLDVLLTDKEGCSLYEYPVTLANVEAGKVTTVKPTQVILPCAIGNWHLVSFCGSEAEVDIYLGLAKDKTFKLYQRTTAEGYTVFTGTWAYDTATKVLSGTYSDGSAWAASYRVALTDDDKLSMTNVSNSAEVSLYEAAELPVVKRSSTRSTVDVKPIL